MSSWAKRASSPINGWPDRLGRLLGLAMPVTDEQMVLLHAYLSGEHELADRLAAQFTSPAADDGIAELVYAAFVTAARRRFPLGWTDADVIRFVAHVRAPRGLPDILDPRAAEHQLRSALGDAMTGYRPDAEARAAAQVILLDALVRDLDLDASARVGLLNQARDLANRLLADQA
jgi:hypothetical protein